MITNKEMILLPAKPGTCPICAVNHDAEQPHNKDSLYYQTRFQMEHGRGATWTDAMAHCSPEMKCFWIEALATHGITIEPEDGNHEQIET